MGRFAPTPSGDLHLGSLYAAVASYLDARAHSGRWLLRFEDLDRPREIPGSATRILKTLEQFGFEWDDLIRQSDRLEYYQAALRTLDNLHLTFPCACSRLQLEDESRYPGTCRERPPAAGLQTAIRLRIEAQQILFTDRIQGAYRQDVAAAVGDIILKRRDGIVAYVLAVVIDDAAQAVTHVVRGADLLDNTPRQIYLQQLLGLPRPLYAHVPVLTEGNDAKLAKSRRSVAVGEHAVLVQLEHVFSLLGLAPPAELGSARLKDAWSWAVQAWNTNKVPKRLNLRVSG